MRITAKIAAAGDRSISQFPIAPGDLESLVSITGRFDEAKARQVLRDVPGLTFGGRDDIAVMAFAIEFLKQLERTVKSLDEDVTRDVTIGAKTKEDHRCERNLEKGRIVYTRLDIQPLAPVEVFSEGSRHRVAAISVKVDVDDPNDTVGMARDFAADHALLWAKIVNFVSTSIGSRLQVFKRDGDHVGDIFALAERDERFWQRQEAELKLHASLIEKRAKCSRRCGEYCSPSCPDCTLYASGKCTEPKLSGKYSDDKRVKVEVR